MKFTMTVGSSRSIFEKPFVSRLANFRGTFVRAVKAVNREMIQVYKSIRLHSIFPLIITTIQLSNHLIIFALFPFQSIFDNLLSH
jgi:hypothetical protein